MNHILFYRIAFFIVLYCEVTISSRITLDKNRYSNIIVGISEDVDYRLGEKLIEALRKLFSQASPKLYNATRKRSYIGDITIVVPKSWPAKLYYDVATSQESFSEADVRVDLPNPSYGDGPFTVQDKGCGEQGRYIHLTPSYLINLEGNSSTIFGDPGKTFVHEWAHFRYGTFDEFGDPRDPQYPIFYFNEKNKLTTNGCTNKKLNGVFSNRKQPQSDCNYDSNGNPDNDCFFIATHSESTTSIGSFHFLPKVFTFCDGTKENKHNSYAPNKHNNMCDGLSAWEVIAMHEDFKNKNLPVELDRIEEPTMRIVQPHEPIFVLILDISISMRVSEKYLFLVEAVRKWLTYEVMLGSAVGIVTFGTDAKVLQPIVKVEDEGIRSQLLSRVEALQDISKYQKNTCIGCGLQTGLESLKAFGLSKGGIILLLTDGRETPFLQPQMRDVIKDIITAEVKVVTLAFTEIADPKIENLAEITGGKSYFINVDSQAQALNSAFYEFSTYQTTKKALFLKVYEEEVTVQTSSYTGYFIIDDTIGENSTVDFMYRNPNSIGTILISPGSFEIKEDPSLKFFRYQSSSLQTGNYSYTIFLNTDADQEKVLVTVTSQARDKKIKPIATSCWIGSITDPQKGTLMIIFAEVKQGSNPVVNASVIASVERPNDHSPVLLQLFDNGNGDPDITRNDGIYSRYFTDYSGTGRYSVKAQVEDKGVAAVLEVGFTASRAMPITHNYYPPDISEVKSKTTGQFSRIASAGSFQIEDESQIVVDLPPGQVRDLATVETLQNKTVLLKWTSPGEDLDSGTVAFYDIRISASSLALRKSFQTESKIDTKSLNPQPAGSIISFRFQMNSPPGGSVHYVALKAIDKKSQESPISNIAQIRFSSSSSSKLTFHWSYWVIISIILTRTAVSL